MLKKQILFWSISALSASSGLAQMGAKFDQFYMDYSLINPAAMNTHTQGHVTLFNNRMFSAVPGGPQHTVLNINMPVPAKNTGYGLFYMRERVGFSEAHNAYATYAYSLPLGGTTNLNLGVSVGALRQSFDMSKAIYISGNDDIIKSLIITPPVTRADLRASAFVNGEKWFGGLAVSRLTNPTFDYTYYKYNASYQLQSQASLLLGFNIDGGGDLVIKPAILVSGYNWDYYRVQFNASAWYQEKFWIGFNANDLGQIGGNIGFTPQEDIRVSYSYTTPTGTQRVALGNTHEFHTFIGFSALGGGKRDSDSEDGESDGGDGQETKNEGDEEGFSGTVNNDRSEVIVKSLADLKAAGLGRDTALLKIQPIDKVKSAPGFYLVAGLHINEAKANKQIKDLYKKGVISFKMFDPTNKSFYVFVKDYATEKEANRDLFYFQSAVPSVWVREVK